MGIKRALFLGGAVLVLAACDSATAPGSLTSHEGSAAASKKASDTDTTTTTTLLPGVITMFDCNGFVIRGGDSLSTECGEIQ